MRCDPGGGLVSISTEPFELLSNRPASPSLHAPSSRRTASSRSASDRIDITYSSRCLPSEGVHLSSRNPSRQDGCSPSRLYARKPLAVASTTQNDLQPSTSSAGVGQDRASRTSRSEAVYSGVGRAAKDWRARPDGR